MKHKETGFTYYLSALDGLKFINYETRQKHMANTEEKSTTDLNSIDYTPENVEVSVAKHWKNK
jgi:type 2A phosphatase activator TIP41